MKKLSVLRLALGYAGMFFGAGFVSGQEIRQFFCVYGTAGLLGLLLSGLLFFFVGAAYFDMALSRPGDTVGEILVPGNHPLLSGLVEAAEGVLLFGVVIIMIAGAGAMVKQAAGIPAFAAGLVFSALIFAASLKNMRSVIAVFSALTPCLTLCAILVAGYVLFGRPASPAAASAVRPDLNLASGSALLAGPWSSAVLYAVYNLFGSFSILHAMVPILPERRKIFSGVGLGAVFLVLPAECVAASMLAEPLSMAEEVPTAYLAGLLSPVFQNIFSLLMLCGMASAALGCLVGLMEQLRLRLGNYTLTRPRYAVLSAGLCLAAWILSLAGFGNLVGIIYPLFGWLGIPCTACLLWRSFPLRRGKDNS